MWRVLFLHRALYLPAAQSLPIKFMAQYREMSGIVGGRSWTVATRGGQAPLLAVRTVGLRSGQGQGHNVTATGHSGQGHNVTAAGDSGQGTTPPRLATPRRMPCAGRSPNRRRCARFTALINVSVQRDTKPSFHWARRQPGDAGRSPRSRPLFPGELRHRVSEGARRRVANCGLLRWCCDTMSACPR